MRASTRRTRTTRRTVAAFAALSLGLAACGGDDSADQPDEQEIEEPADDAAEEDLDGAEDPSAAGFGEDLEEGEVVPGVRMDVPADETLPTQAQPTPFGSAYAAALPQQSGSVSLNVEFDGASFEELLGSVEAIEESGQAEVTSGPDEIEVEGADEAARVELAAPEGGATATAVFAVADGNAILVEVAVTEDSDVDVDAILDSIVIDPERLQVAGTAEMPQAPAEGGADAGVDGAADAGAGTDGAPAPEGDTGGAPAPEGDTDGA